MPFFLTFNLRQFAAVFLAYKGIENVAKVEGRAIRLSDLFSNHIFRNIVISLAATLGLYLVSSIIFVRDYLCVR